MSPDLKLPDARLKAHHIGCLTANMEASLEVYRMMGFGNISKIFTIHQQKVRVCFVEIADKMFLELVEFSDDNPALKTIFKSKNPYYHIGYLASNFASTIAVLEEKGFRLINTFSSEAFNGKTCAFMYTPEMHLIELIEAQ